MCVYLLFHSDIPIYKNGQPFQQNEEKWNYPHCVRAINGK
jgi:hypothetical protein